MHTYVSHLSASAQTMSSADFGKAVNIFLARPFSGSHVTFSCSQPRCRICEAPEDSHIAPASPKDAPPAATQHDMDVVESWFASLCGTCRKKRRRTREGGLMDLQDRNTQMLVVALLFGAAFALYLYRKRKAREQEEMSAQPMMTHAGDGDRGAHRDKKNMCGAWITREWGPEYSDFLNYPSPASQQRKMAKKFPVPESNPRTRHAMASLKTSLA